MEVEFHQVMENLGLNSRDEKMRRLADWFIDTYKSRFGTLSNPFQKRHMLFQGVVPSRGPGARAMGFSVCTECGGPLQVTRLLSSMIEESECTLCGMLHAYGLAFAVDLARQRAKAEGRRIVTGTDS